MICLLCLFKDHLQNNALYEKFQSGFRPYHIAEAALLRVSDDLHMYSLQLTVSCFIFGFLIYFSQDRPHSLELSLGKSDCTIPSMAFGEFRPYVTTSTNRFSKQDGILFFFLSSHSFAYQFPENQSFGFMLQWRLYLLYWQLSSIRTVPCVSHWHQG